MREQDSPTGIRISVTSGFRNLLALSVAASASFPNVCSTRFQNYGFYVIVKIDSEARNTSQPLILTIDINLFKRSNSLFRNYSVIEKYCTRIHMP